MATKDAPSSGTQADDADGQDLSSSLGSRLRLGFRPVSSIAQRERRLSDGDSPSSVVQASSSKPGAMAIRSTDGSRWIPVPDSHSFTTTSCTNRASQPEDPGEDRKLEAHVCHSSSCAAKHVFETTELLEMILSFMSTDDVLKNQLVNTGWNAAIKESPNLRLHFFVRQQWQRKPADFSLLPLSMPGLQIKLGPEIKLGRWIEVTLTAAGARRISSTTRPTLRARSRSIFEGLRGGFVTGKAKSKWPQDESTVDPRPVNTTVDVEDLYITQPPIVGMQAFINDSDPQATSLASNSGEDAAADEPTACAKLSCEAGITLGFLAETAQSLLKSGTTDEAHSVKYTAIVSFCEPRPLGRKRRNSRTVMRFN